MKVSIHHEEVMSIRRAKRIILPVNVTLHSLPQKCTVNIMKNLFKKCTSQPRREGRHF